MKLGLRTCIYMVPNLAEAKKWYADVFETQPYFDTDFYVGFNIAGYELGLSPEKETIKHKTANVFTYWGVDNAYEAYAELLKKGCTPEEEPMDVGENIIVAAVRDPWGNVIGVIDNPVFKLPD